MCGFGFHLAWVLFWMVDAIGGCMYYYEVDRGGVVWT